MKLENKEVLSKNLNYYMDKHGISRNELCEKLDLKYMTLSDWINGKTYPRIDKIELLANFFGINKSDLIEDKRKTKTSTLTEQEQRLLKNYNSTTEKGKKRIMTTSEEMVELYPIIDREMILKFFEENEMQSAALSGKHLNNKSDEELYTIYKAIKGD
ncbi:helix-turn-helix transcriptional regulator [Helcococcus bovis]|uniref:helix-turn-helix domain-containing protein n=1 Tax=Helcococcus bovis TaxID=3153252 RepID=UPI0038BC7F7A